MHSLFKHIEKQLTFNENKNLFNENDLNGLKFIEETYLSVNKLKNLDADSEEILINYTIEKVIEKFIHVNQYYSFDKTSIEKLKRIYIDLFRQMKDVGLNTSQITFDKIAACHYNKLKDWLKSSNPFAEKIYPSSQIELTKVICSEYSPELQLKILRIDLFGILEPVLDLGCGKNGHLVNYLHDKGIESFGIDRFYVDCNNISQADWLEYSFELNSWGTIISNLGFSNHFRHHHLREDGNFLGYATKYMEILKSLKIGGSFIYAPDLPFIETYLNSEQYNVTNFDIEGMNYKSTQIRRKK